MKQDSYQNPGLEDQETTYIIQPELGRDKQSRNLTAICEEVEGLARAINLDVKKTKSIKINRIQAGSFLGKGQRQDIKDEINDLKPNVVIFNYELSPVQQRNLEREWKVKVIDRTGLILEIFGERAETKEGRLQVELAALDYQRSRLVRSWTHLERQRGGAGFMGGPGETQIEIDRRLIGQRISSLKKQLEDVRRTRDLGRKSRERVPFPVIALVGYTNAGKSTLFNTLTKARVFAEDLPFATLDPKMRRLDLPHKQEAILSDTVGFISDLPTHLIAAFRATLEQITHADVIVHVIDVSRGDYRAQKEDVIKVLSELGIEYEEDPRIVEVFNKVDLLPEENLAEFERLAKFSENTALISATKEQGVDDFLSLISEKITSARIKAAFQINITDGKALSWLYEHAEILDRQDAESHVTIKVMIEPSELARFKTLHQYRESSEAL